MQVRTREERDIEIYIQALFSCVGLQSEDIWKRYEIRDVLKECRVSSQNFFEVYYFRIPS